MKRVLILLGFAFQVMNAQQPTILYQQLFTATQTTGVSAVVRSNGQQAFSKLDVYAVDKVPGSQICNNFVGVIYFEASFDNTNFYQIGSALTRLDFITTTTYQGTLGVSGAYPYIRARYVSGFSNCVMTISYAGTPSGAATSSAPYTAFADFFPQIYLDIATMTKTTFNMSCPSTTQPVIYGMVANSYGGDNSFSLFDGVSGGTVLYKAAVLNGQSLILQQGSRSWMNLGPTVSGSASYAVQLSAATGMTFLMKYRCE